MSILLLIIIYIAFISLGLPDSLLGSAWPVIHTELNIPVSYMGIVSMTISGGTIISSIFSDKLTKKLGTSIVTVISVFLTVIAMIGFSFSNEFYLIIIFAIPYGLGAGAIDAALNNYVAINYSSRSMSWLHSFWGVGTIVSPFIMSYCLTNYNWNTGYRIIGYVQLGIGLLLLFTLPIWKKVKFKISEESREHLGVIKTLKIKGVPFLLIGFFAYCAQEATAMNWASSYLVNLKGVEEETAAMFASLFFIGMTCGRFISGFISNKLGDQKMIRLGTGILFIGLILLIIPVQNDVVALIGLIVIGLGCAPIYPSTIHSTPYNFGADKSGSIIGIQMASAYVGSTFMPLLFGIIAENIGFNIFPYYLLFFVILIFIMLELTFKITKNNRIEQQIV